MTIMAASKMLLENASHVSRGRALRSNHGIYLASFNRKPVHILNAKRNCNPEAFSRNPKPVSSNTFASHMQTAKNSESQSLGLSSLLNLQSADSNLDPVNSLLWYNPMAANAYSGTTFSEESYCIYPHGVPGQKICKDAWSHEFVADKNGDYGSPRREMKSVDSIACTSPAAKCFPNPEEQLSADICANNKCLESAGEIADSEPSKSRKIRKTEKGPRYVFKTRSERDVLEDGYKWRKYGRKFLRSSPHPRSYYKCSENNCSVKKRVEREASDPGLLRTTYEGTHNHESPTVIYYIGKPIILPQVPGSKPAVVLVNAGGVCSEAVFTFASQQAL